MVHYAEAMRTRRRVFWALLAALALVVVWLLRVRQGALEIAIGWVALLAGLIVGNAVFFCPACGKRMSSLFEKLCSHCGAVLTDEAVVPPAVDGPADPRAVEYMAKSRRILERWGAIRRVLGKSVLWSGALTFVGVAAFFWHADPTRPAEAAFIGLFAGAVACALSWLFLVFAVDNLFGVGFLALRGRCPICRAWFNPPSTVGPETIHLDYSLPKFCAHCSAKLS